MHNIGMSTDELREFGRMVVAQIDRKLMQTGDIYGQYVDVDATLADIDRLRALVELLPRRPAEVKAA